MKRVLLHIGMHKTGSSSIQHSLKGYKDSTTHYANFPEDNHSIPIYTIFSNNRHRYHIWTNKGLTHEEIDAKKSRYLKILEDDLRNRNFEQLIISGEDISVLQAEEKEELIRFLKSRGAEVRVVCFLRDPRNVAASIIQQTIRGGQTELRPLNPSYTGRLKTFSQLLPKDNVIVKDFEEIVREYGDITKGFAEICKLENDLEVKRSNESLSATATRLVFRLNKLPVATFGSRQRMTARGEFTALISESFPVTSDDKLDKEMFALLLSHHVNKDIAYVSENFGIHYDLVPEENDTEAPQEYLNNLSALNIEKLRDILRKQNVPFEPQDPVNSLIIGLYSALANPVRVKGYDAEYLRSIALKIQEGELLNPNDASLIALFVHRAGRLIRSLKGKIEKHTAKLKKF